MNRQTFRFLMTVPLLLGLMSGTLAGCSSAKETLGLNRQSPDEFKVLKRAPLSMPPDYALRPPVPGAPRPQEQAAAQEAAQTVFGTTATQNAQAPSTGAQILLQKAGADQANANIRTQIDREAVSLNAENKTVADKLLGLGGLGSNEPEASVVNARKEAQRLQDNAEQGAPVTEGETPTIED